mmetsp:Transcript_44957/g.142728  ORF Transcript_44957/g.142728 Transcript_44957/m.142728 type:complete len:203 (+) Transcript_44957:57-665(+)
MAKNKGGVQLPRLPRLEETADFARRALGLCTSDHAASGVVEVVADAGGAGGGHDGRVRPHQPLVQRRLVGRVGASWPRRRRHTHLEGLVYEEELLVFVHSAEVELEELRLLRDQRDRLSPREHIGPHGMEQRLEPGCGALRVIGRAMLEEGRVLLGCRSELLQLRVHALLDFASGVEAAQEHRSCPALRPARLLEAERSGLL